MQYTKVTSGLIHPTHYNIMQKFGWGVTYLLKYCKNHIQASLLSLLTIAKVSGKTFWLPSFAIVVNKVPQYFHVKKCVIYLSNRFAILKSFDAWLKIPKHTIKNHLRRIILTILYWIVCFVSNNCTMYKVLNNFHQYRKITIWFFQVSKFNFECFFLVVHAFFCMSQTKAL